MEIIFEIDRVVTIQLFFNNQTLICLCKKHLYGTLNLVFIKSVILSQAKYNQIQEFVLLFLLRT